MPSAKARKAKAPKETRTVSFTGVAKDTLSTETHMQMMRRLGLDGGLVFAHGTPKKREPRRAH